MLIVIFHPQGKKNWVCYFTGYGSETGSVKSTVRLGGNYTTCRSDIWCTISGDSAILSLTLDGTGYKIAYRLYCSVIMFTMVM